MDDKAYLRPGTDVGARDSKAGVVFDVVDPNKRRELPQHDFNEPKVNQTPASFRFIKGCIEHKQEDILINSSDQTLVIVRPKSNIGSSGSVWASDYMRLCHEQPQLFQESRSHAYSMPLKKFSSYLHDTAYYFSDLTMEEDVRNASSEPECQYKLYEEHKLRWLEQQIDEAIQSWNAEEEDGILNSDKEIGHELKAKAVEIQIKAECCIDNCSQLIADNNLYEKEEEVSNDCKNLCCTIERMQLTPWCCDVFKATDAGPGVGVSNLEVRFRDIEIARIHNSDRVSRVHRAPGDSGQNEAERSNAAIGDALVDGSALKWNYYGPLDGLSQDEIENLSLIDLQKREEDCIEKNAWRVAKEVAQTIHDEPGPAGDYIKSYVTTQKERQFFFNTPYLQQYASSKSDVKKATVPGNAYFLKIEKFMQEHCEIGEMYLEILKGSCESGEGEKCEYCLSHEFCSSAGIKHIPRPYPDQQRPGLHYRPPKDTPTVDRGVDDFHPRVQMKAAFNKDSSFFDNPDNIKEFSKKYVVTEDAIKSYVNHMKLLSLRKEKRSKDKAEKRQEQASKTYEDYDWEGMFNNRSLSKLKVLELDKYIAYHKLGISGTKKVKLEAIKANIIRQLSRRIEEDEEDQLSEDVSSSESEDDTDQDTEEDYVLAEIGDSSSEEEEEYEEDEEEEATESAGKCDVDTSVVYTRSGRRATQIRIH